MNTLEKTIMTGLCIAAALSICALLYGLFGTF
jgi:hypothetical protein